MSRRLVDHPCMKVPSVGHRPRMRDAIVALLTLCAWLACRSHVMAVPEGPALHENWKTVWPALSVGPGYVVEGHDRQHVIVFGALGISSLNPASGEQEWTKKISLFDERGIIMLRSRPEFVLFGSITDRDLYPGQESHRGWIQVRSYPGGEVVRTILMPGGGNADLVGLVSPTLSDNERYVAGTRGGDTHIYVWDIETGEIVWDRPEPYPEAPYAGHGTTCWTRDSTRLIITVTTPGFGRVVECWDIERNTLVWSKPIENPYGRNHPINGRMSRNGKRLIYHQGPFEVREFPSLELVYEREWAAPNAESDDGHWFIFSAGADNYPSLVVANVDANTYTVLDTTKYDLLGQVYNGHIYLVHIEDTPSYALHYLHQLDFDWAVASAPAEGTAPSEVFFPSPCYREGTLSYQVAGEQRVSVRLYDMSGRIIATLAEGLQQGPQQVQVDCQQAPPGAYLLVVQVGATVTTHHILLEGREGGGQ